MSSNLSPETKEKIARLGEKNHLAAANALEQQGLPDLAEHERRAIECNRAGALASLTANAGLAVVRAANVAGAVARPALVVLDDGHFVDGRLKRMWRRIKRKLGLGM